MIGRAWRRFVCRLHGHRPFLSLYRTQTLLIETTRCARCRRLLEARGDGRLGRAARRRVRRGIRRAAA